MYTRISDNQLHRAHYTALGRYVSKKKGKAHPSTGPQCRTAHGGSRGIALLIHDPGTGRGEGSASRPGRSLPPGKTLYPLYRRLGRPQERSGQVRKTSPHPDSIPGPSSP